MVRVWQRFTLAGYFGPPGYNPLVFLGDPADDNLSCLHHMLWVVFRAPYVHILQGARVEAKVLSRDPHLTPLLSMEVPPFCQGCPGTRENCPAR